MKVRRLLILGLLVFLNGFVFTVLFLVVSRQIARPAATPIPAATMEPTIQATFTSTATGTPTEMPPPTNTPEPTPTNTLVVAPSTPTPTETAAPPTSTPVPPTPTFTPAPPTPTTAPPTATPTTPMASPTSTSPAYQYSMLSSEYLPNCGLTFIEGTVWNPDRATQRSDVRVRVWTAGWESPIRVTPTDPGKGPGYYDVILSTEGPREGNWFVAVIDANGNPLSETVSFNTNTVDCEPNGTGHQWIIIDFVANY